MTQGTGSKLDWPPQRLYYLQPAVAGAEFVDGAWCTASMRRSQLDADRRLDTTSEK